MGAGQSAHFADCKRGCWTCTRTVVQSPVQRQQGAQDPLCAPHVTRPMCPACRKLHRNASNCTLNTCSCNLLLKLLLLICPLLFTSISFSIQSTPCLSPVRSSPGTPRPTLAPSYPKTTPKPSPSLPATSQEKASASTPSGKRSITMLIVAKPLT